MRDYPSVLMIIITCSLIFLIWWSRAMARESSLARWGMALILGGAIGNWIDRVRFGAVIDFLDFRIWPVFNLADSSITIGVALYFILILRKDRQVKTIKDS